MKCGVMTSSWMPRPMEARCGSCRSSIEYTRECLMLKAARSFPARRVIDALEEVLICSGRKPKHVRSDNGPEFLARAVQQWLATAPVSYTHLTLPTICSV